MTDLDPLPPATLVGQLRLFGSYELIVRIDHEGSSHRVIQSRSKPGEPLRPSSLGVADLIDRYIEEGLMEELFNGVIRLSEDGHAAIRFFYENSRNEVYIAAP